VATMKPTAAETEIARLRALLADALAWDDALMRDDPEQIEPDWKADAREVLGLDRA
jgi:hypothetical protein